jgi:hypothetical protein
VASLSPAAPIVVPIMASVVLVKWVHDVYQLSYVPQRHVLDQVTEPAQPRGAAALYSVHRGFDDGPADALSRF